jgi:HSP20 family protein
MRRQMDRLYDDVMTSEQSGRAGVFPPINLTEDKDNYYVRAELPGVTGDDLDIQVTANNLAISGERKIAAEEGVRYHRRDREAGTFSRMISLPGEIDADKIDARLKNGVLSIAISKAEVAKPKQIAVK